MRKHDKMSRFGALFLALVMVIAMCLPGVARAADDKATITIQNIEGDHPNVTLYKVVEAANGNFVLTSGAKTALGDAAKDFDTEAAPSAKDINTLAQNTAQLGEAITEGTTDGTTYKSPDLEPGSYLAIISASGYVYNPMYISVSYENGKAKAKTFDLDKATYNDETAVAKKSKPEISKTVEGTQDGNYQTAGIGDVVTYTVNPVIPTYPSNAKNKTFFVSDRMSEGLDFLPTVSIKLDEDTAIDVTATGEDSEVKKDEKTIAKIKKVDNGFNLVFFYDKLVKDPTTQAIPEITVSYKARINAKAKVGSEGNANNVNLIYSNDPSEGETHETTDEPDDQATELETTTDTEKVYTYQIAFKKVTDDAQPLAGAVFGIYSDDGCTEKVDQVVTNAEGIAVSTLVKAGDYWVKELVAPPGYTLNDNPYKVTANWKTVTSTSLTTVVETEYTSNKDKSTDKVQVGYLKDGVFYAEEVDGAQPAYIKGKQSTTTTKTLTEGSKPGSGVAVFGDKIPNTQIKELPSTGGMGTYVFTILGVAIIAIAGGLYMKKRNH